MQENVFNRNQRKFPQDQSSSKQMAALTIMTLIRSHPYPYQKYVLGNNVNLQIQQ